MERLLYLFIELWLLFLKLSLKTRSSQVVAIGQDNMYKSSQLSLVK